MYDTKVGDWVRFYQAGTLVIGVVQYVGKKDVLNKRDIMTDVGIVSEGSIIEARNSYVKLD